MVETETQEQRLRRVGAPPVPPAAGGARSFILQVSSFVIATISCILLIVLTLLALEWSFAVAHIGEDTVVTPDPLLGYAHLNQQRLVYRQEGFSVSRTNSLGFREREFSIVKPADATRICVLGDSMTVGMEVPPEFTFTRLLENYLNNEGHGKFEVLNCGMSGFGTGQEYLLYRQKVRQLHPDVLVLTYNIGDAEDNVFQRVGMNPPRPIFRVENGILRAELQQITDWFASPDARFYSSFECLRRHSRVLSVLTKLNLDLSNSDPTYKAIVGWVGKPIGIVWGKVLNSLPVVPPNIPDASQTTFEFTDPVSYSGEINHLLPQAVPPALNQAPATLELRQAFAATRSATEVTLGILQSLNRDCKQDNCKLVVVAAPGLTNSAFFQRELLSIKALAARDGFQIIDSGKTFPARAPMQVSPYFFGLHFTRAGHQVMSKAIFYGLKNEPVPSLESTVTPVVPAPKPVTSLRRKLKAEQTGAESENAEAISIPQSVPDTIENAETSEESTVSNDESNKDASNQEQADQELNQGMSEADKVRALRKAKGGSGLTGELGKPLVKQEEVSNRAEEIESKYQELSKYKKFATSGITSAFGDLLSPSKKEEEKKSESGDSTEK